MNTRRLISKRFSRSNSENVRSHYSFDRRKIIDMVKRNVTEGSTESYRMLDYSCVCGSSSGFVVSEIDRYGLPLTSIMCENCATIRLTPFPDNESMSDFYTHYYQDMYKRSNDVRKYFDIQKSYGKKHLALNPQLKPGDLVIELGCGAGGALQVFKDAGFDVAGHDFDNRLLVYGNSKGLNLHYGSILRLQESLKGRKAALIFSNHVFEHIADPFGTLLICKEMLAEGGRIIHAVPDIYKCHNNDSYHGDLLQMIHISHIFNYTREGLSIMASRAELSTKELFPDASIKTPTSGMGEMWIEMWAGSGYTRMPSGNIAEKKLDILVKQEKAFKAKKNKGLFRKIWDRVRLN